MHYVVPPEVRAWASPPLVNRPRGSILKPCAVFWLLGAQLGSEAGGRLLKPDMALGDWPGKGL